MAESPRELQTLLQISHEFAKKWNLKFNSKKSKVMVVGKRINNNSTWKLGDESIEEVNEYKYLGYFVNRTLKSNFHICNFLKEKADKQLNYMIRVLEEHGDFNRLNFGDALWNSVIRPSLTHACAVWMPLSQASKDSLDSWQYKAAKTILRTKLNIPKAAILLELGWEPLSVFIDRQRISYYKRLLRLPNHRLCKQVYNEMINNNDTFWDYDTLNLDIIRDVTPDVSCFESQSQASLNSMFGTNTRNKMMLEVQTKSSLDLYQNCFVRIGRQSYLCDNDFRSSRLKLLARTKTIPLKKYLYRMNMSQTDVCDLCNAEVGEDLEHVFFDCPVYDEIRLKFSSLFNPEPYECLVFNFSFAELLPAAKIQFLIGDIGYLFSSDVGYFYDSLGKMFLKECFDLRHDLLNS